MAEIDNCLEATGRAYLRGKQDEKELIKDLIDLYVIEDSEYVRIPADDYKIILKHLMGDI